MATIKSFTSLEQSKKLAEILPIESADMYYEKGIGDNYRIDFGNYADISISKNLLHFDVIPCWSLAALLNVLRTFTTPTAFSVKVSTPSLIKIENGYKLTYTGDYTPMINNELDVEAPIESVADNAIDCCVNMIILLYELKIL